MSHHVISTAASGCQPTCPGTRCSAGASPVLALGLRTPRHGAALSTGSIQEDTLVDSAPPSAVPRAIRQESALLHLAATLFTRKQSSHGNRRLMSGNTATR